jgi:ABC-type iron transport system FetAB ATPase subunit
MQLSITGFVHGHDRDALALHDGSSSTRVGMFGPLRPSGTRASTLMRTVATLRSPASSNQSVYGNKGGAG